MRTFTPAPQTLAFLAGIERFIATKNPKAIVSPGPTPTDPEQRAFHLHLIDLVPAVTQAVSAVQALTSYQAALAKAEAEAAARSAGVIPL